MFETKHWVIEIQNEWEQLWGKYNWYTFTLLNIYFENDAMTGGYEFSFWVLGLGIRVHYNTNKSLELFKKWEKETEDIKKAAPDITPDT